MIIFISTFHVIIQTIRVFYKVLQGFWYFLQHKTQCPQTYIKLTPFEDNDSRKLPYKYYLMRCCSFREMSKTMSWKYVFTYYNNFRLTITETKIIFITLFCSFLIFLGKLSNIIIFKLHKFSVNLWTLCFFVLQKVHRPFNAHIVMSWMHLCINPDTLAY